MRVRRFDWTTAGSVAREIRAWARESAAPVDVAPIAREVIEGGDAALLRLGERFDGVAAESLRIDAAEIAAALESLDPAVREALETAATNIRAVAEAQVDDLPKTVDLPQGQSIVLHDVAVGAAGVYAPGGRAAYPSSVLMCCIPARAAGVARLAVCSPPGADGRVHPVVLAACALCEVDEVYATGGAQAIVALAIGTESVAAVDVVVGPGNAWVQEAKRWAYGRVGIDGIAGPSELMLLPAMTPSSIGWRWTSAPRPSTAPTAPWSRWRWRKRYWAGSSPRCWRWPRSAPASPTRSWPWFRCPTSPTPSSSPMPMHPSTCSS